MAISSFMYDQQKLLLWYIALFVFLTKTQSVTLYGIRSRIERHVENSLKEKIGLINLNNLQKKIKGLIKLNNFQKKNKADSIYSQTKRRTVSTIFFLSRLPYPKRMSLVSKVANNWQKFEQNFVKSSITRRLSRESDSSYQIALFSEEEAYDIYDGLRFDCEEDKMDLRIVSWYLPRPTE